MVLSGKTTLAKKLITEYKNQGIKTIVLDPLADPGYLADFKTTNPDEFLKIFWASRQCAVFVDESGDMIGRFDSVMQRPATLGRHLGHKLHFISQRGAQINKTVRDQCSKLYLFTSSFTDCKIHANEWNKPELESAFTLPQGHFYTVTRFGECKFSRLW
jgi:hypothetical protein